MENGFERGKASPCLFYHDKNKIRLSVHGDDFVGTGPLCHLRWVMELLDKNFEAKHKVMGGSKHLLKELRILNRHIQWTRDGITIEADKKHVITILKEMDLMDAKSVVTPAVREEGARGSRQVNDDEDDEAELRGEESEGKGSKDEQEEEDKQLYKYRSWAARLNYLAIDRPDIQYAVKACAKAMSSPSNRDLQK